MAYHSLGESEKAAEDVQEAYPILEKELERTGRDELRDVLETAKKELSQYVNSLN